MNLKDRLSNVVATAQARVVGAVEPTGENTLTSDLERINRHALKPITEADIFIFEFELSNSNVDAYFTRMTQESLDNYSTRINSAGIPLLANHNDHTFPVGRIYWADVTRTDDGVYRLICRAYIVRGDENADVGISGDSLIRKIETGVQKDTSIGFIPGGYTCSICGGDMVSGFFSRAEGDCDHLPGATYDGKVCYAWVEDGIILEGSLVYTGATPQAIIQKAVNTHQLGKLDSTMLHSVRNALNVELVTEQQMKAKELLTRVASCAALSETMKRSLEIRAEALGDEPEEQGVDAIAEEVAKVEQDNETLREENKTLKADAEDGREYRDTIVNEALDEGVRALGSEFKRDDMEKMFRSLPIAQVRTFKAGYESITNKLANGVNLTQDEKTELEQTDPKAAERSIPVDAFK